MGFFSVLDEDTLCLFGHAVQKTCVFSAQRAHWIVADLKKTGNFTVFLSPACTGSRILVAPGFCLASSVTSRFLVGAKTQKLLVNIC